jgi:hypothetical protein
MVKALAEFRFIRLGKHFMEPRDYDEIPLCNIQYFIRGTGLLAELSRWGRAIDQKTVAVHGSPISSTHSH